MPAAARAFHTFSLLHPGFSLAHASTSTAAALEERLAAAGKPPIRTRAPIEEPGGRVTVLDRVDLETRLEPAEYEKRLVDAQSRLSWRGGRTGRVARWWRCSRVGMPREKGAPSGG